MLANDSLGGSQVERVHFIAEKIKGGFAKDLAAFVEQEAQFAGGFTKAKDGFDEGFRGGLDLLFEEFSDFVVGQSAVGPH
jgi:hypothetical protein